MITRAAGQQNLTFPQRRSISLVPESRSRPLMAERDGFDARPGRALVDKRGLRAREEELATPLGRRARRFPSALHVRNPLEACSVVFEEEGFVQRDDDDEQQWIDRLSRSTW